jgi:hypothetical protein
MAFCCAQLSAAGRSVLPGGLRVGDLELQPAQKVEHALQRLHGAQQKARDQRQKVLDEAQQAGRQHQAGACRHGLGPVDERGQNLIGLSGVQIGKIAHELQYLQQALHARHDRRDLQHQAEAHRAIGRDAARDVGDALERAADR